jgi:hypothetical protein
MSKRLDGKKQLEQMLNQPLPVSDTPRTDAETWRDEMDHVDTDYTFAQSVTVSADFARQLERELAEAREDAANQRRLADMALAHRDVIIAERDTLEEALQEIKDICLDKTIELHPDDNCKGVIDDLLDIAEQTLAATKGGSHE